MKRIFAILLALTLTLVLCACTPGDGGTDTNIGSIPNEDLIGNGILSNFDLEDDMDASAIQITLADNASKANGEGVSVSGNVVTISAEGTYVATGTLSDGQIIIAAAKTAKIRLILNAVSITSKSSAPLYVSSADKVVITLAEGTENRLSDKNVVHSGSDTDAASINACLFARDDMTINGKGKLTIEASANGIEGKNDIRICGGEYTISAVNNGIKGKDTLVIAAGTVNVTAGKDGLKSDNETEADRGVVTIVGGTVKINAKDDGIQAVTDVTISGGSVTIVAADNKINCDGTQHISDGCVK